MTQFQVRKDQLTQGRIVDTSNLEDLSFAEGEIIVKLDHFAYTSNNITYAVVGDRMKYWDFFPPEGEDADAWGVIPVWGFADVVASKVEEVPVGDRLFGYFSPATYLRMNPVNISAKRFVDGAAHRAQLPAGYNLYQRVFTEPGYDKAMDQVRMLLSPLYLTSFCLWDFVKDKDWYGAEQIIITSASSKTSIGLAFAFKEDEVAPKTIALTSQGNMKMVEKLAYYNQVFSYDSLADIDFSIPTVIIDMSGNLEILKSLYTHLGDQMQYCINVGLTHWEETGARKDILAEKSEFFFAPGHIKKRLEEWGPAGFGEKTTAFLQAGFSETKDWLSFRSVNGLEGLNEIHEAVCAGRIAPNEGLIVKL